jgi:hypothetical protein
LVDTEIDHNYFSITVNMKPIPLPFVRKETASLSVQHMAIANA